MAYHDMDGSITIDEAAAAADRQKIRQALGILAKVDSALKQVRAEAETMHGDTPTAITEKAMEMETKIKTLTGNLKGTDSYIGSVVAKYKELDRKYAAYMASMKTTITK